MAVETLIKIKSKKTKLSKEQRLENKKRSEFRKHIQNIFVYSGFKALKWDGNFIWAASQMSLTIALYTKI